MPENVYEILSLGMRYWFVFLGLLIVWRSFRWLRKDRKARHRRLRQLPDAGMIGEMVVLQGSDELPEGTCIPVPRSGVLGFLRSCDIIVPVSGVAKQHLDFVFQDGKGLLVFPLRGVTCCVNDVELDHRSKTKRHPLGHGSILQVGDAVLRLRLFAGLDAEYRPHLPYEPVFTEADSFAEPPCGWSQAEFSYDDQPPVQEEEPTWLNPPQPTYRRRHSHDE